MDATKPNKPKSNFTAYLILIFAAFISIAIYLNYKENIDRQVNIDYFRQLSEAEDSLTHQVLRIKALIKFKEFDTLSRLYNSYNNTSSSNPHCKFQSGLQTNIDDISIKIGTLNNMCFISQSNTISIDLNEMLAKLSNRFDEILLANEDSIIIGHSNKYSIHNINNLKQLINESFSQSSSSFITNLLSKNTKTSSEGDKKISKTSYTDTLLGGQKSRIFFHPIEQQNLQNEHSFFIVAILSHQKLTSRDPLSHNLPFLIFGVLFLLSTWVITLLWFYPPHASLTKFTRNLSIITLYGLLFTTLALALSMSFKNRVKAHQVELASQRVASLNKQLLNEIKQAQNKLQQHKGVLEELWEIPNPLSSFVNYFQNSNILNPQFSQLKIEDNTKEYLYTYDDAVSGAIDCFIIYKESTKDKNDRANKELPKKKQLCPFAMNKDVIADIKGTEKDSAISMRFIGSELSYHRSSDSGSTLKSPQYLANLKVNDGSNAPHKNKVFPVGVFMTNDEGRSTISIHHHETNLTSGTSVAHRSYIKEIQRGNGWKIPNESASLPPIYLQRLYNIANGSLGTTISIPSKYANQVVAGDFYLPSIFTMGSTDYSKQTDTANAWISELKLMVTNRQSGEVIFHSDNQRSLKENLITLNSNKAKEFAAWLASSIPTKDNKQANFNGYYHGESGKYLKSTALFGPYVVTAFLPDSSLKSLAVNQFTYLLTCISLVMLTVISLTSLSALISNRSQNQKANRYIINGIKHPFFYRLHLPTIILVIVLIMTEAYWISALTTLATAALLCLLIGLYSRKEFIKSQTHFTEFTIESVINHKAAQSTLITLLVCGLLVYSSYNSSMSIFNDYQIKVFQANKQQNHNEIAGFYREYFPKVLAKCVTGIPDNKKTICPWFDLSDPEHLKTVDFATYIKLRLFKLFIGEQLSVIKDRKGKALTSSVNAPSLAWLGFAIMFASIWLLIYTSWAKPRLLLSTGTRKHLTLMRMVNHDLALNEAQSTQTTPTQAALTICIGMTKRHGRNLGFGLEKPTSTIMKTLINIMPKNQHTPENTEVSSQDSSSHRSEASYKEMLPSIKYHYNESKHCLALWDLEICLETDYTRTQLLKLIEGLKELNEEQNLAVTLHCSSATLDKLNWLDELQLKNFETLGHRDMLAWSECLMDFNVMVSEEIQRYYLGLDKRIAEAEQISLPELASIPLYLDQLANQNAFVKGSFTQSNCHSKAHTYSYLLHLYSATYRYKWESCNDNEKLALFYLARDEQINPQNKNLISILAQKGLIELKPNGIDLKIINETFKIYVKYAESQKVFDQLKRRGTAGTWSNFKVPFTLLIIMAVIGLALTSGQSIFVLLGGISAALSSIASIRTHIGVGNK
ncbi:hypothetical protein [Shewanella waksmanii]|uniref:hypothetical protein n=1 Tax=Shewanella waksmanii TaxID=213783 RepID=UPI003736BC34